MSAGTMTFDQVARLETKLIEDLDDQGWATINALPVERRFDFFNQMSWVAETNYRLDRIEEMNPAILRVMRVESFRRFVANGGRWAFRKPSEEAGRDFGLAVLAAAGEAVDRSVAFDDDDALTEIIQRRGLFDWESLILGPEEGGVQ